MITTMPSDPTVIGLVTQGLAEVKDAVAQLSKDLHVTLRSLPNDYVPRREVERWRDERTVDIGALRADLITERKAREDAIRELCDARDAAEVAATAHRRWLIGLVAASSISIVGVISGVALHFT